MLNYKASLASYPTEAWQKVIRNAVEQEEKNLAEYDTTKSAAVVGLGSTLTAPGQAGDRAVQAGTKSINNKDPSRQDQQPQRPTDQLQQEREKDPQGPTPIRTTGSRASRKPQHTRASTHALYHTTADVHGSLGAVIIF